MQKRYLFTPGPTPVPPEVLAASAEPMVHHRGARLPRDLRAHARAARGGLPHREPRAALQRLGHRRDGLRGHESLPRRASASPSSSRARSASAGRRCARHYGLDVAAHRLRLGRASPTPPRSAPRSRESGARDRLLPPSRRPRPVSSRDVQALKAAVGEAVARRRRRLLARRRAARDRRLGRSTSSSRARRRR